MDAANLLKPALVRGDFRVIGHHRREYDRWVRRRSGARTALPAQHGARAVIGGDADILRARQARLERITTSHLRRVTAAPRSTSPISTRPIAGAGSRHRRAGRSAPYARHRELLTHAERSSQATRAVRELTPALVRPAKETSRWISRSIAVFQRSSNLARARGDFHRSASVPSGAVSAKRKTDAHAQIRT